MTDSLTSLSFWDAVWRRGVRTAAQSAILTIGADQFNIIAVDWATIGGFAAGGFALSVLTSLAVAPPESKS
jgi:hypothetical protein